MAKTVYPRNVRTPQGNFHCPEGEGPRDPSCCSSPLPSTKVGVEVTRLYMPVCGFTELSSCMNDSGRSRPLESRQNQSRCRIGRKPALRLFPSLSHTGEREGRRRTSSALIVLLLTIFVRSKRS